MLTPSLPARHCAEGAQLLAGAPARVCTPVPCLCASGSMCASRASDPAACGGSPCTRLPGWHRLLLAMGDEGAAADVLRRLANSARNLGVLLSGVAWALGRGREGGLQLDVLGLADGAHTRGLPGAGAHAPDALRGAPTCGCRHRGAPPCCHASWAPGACCALLNLWPPPAPAAPRRDLRCQVLLLAVALLEVTHRPASLLQLPDMATSKRIVDAGKRRLARPAFPERPAAGHVCTHAGLSARAPLDLWICRRMSEQRPDAWPWVPRCAPYQRQAAQRACIMRRAAGCKAAPPPCAPCRQTWRTALLACCGPAPTAELEHTVSA